jgi:hypothetical protein
LPFSRTLRSGDFALAVADVVHRHVEALGEVAQVVAEQVLALLPVVDRLRVHLQPVGKLALRPGVRVP